MRSFRARRQESQWGLAEDGGVAVGESGGGAQPDVNNNNSSSARRGLRRGESLRSITKPASDDRELPGGRLVNEEAVYNMRKKWISDRLIER